LAAFFILRLTGGFSSILFSAIAGALALVLISSSSNQIRRFQSATILTLVVCFFLIQSFYTVLKFPHPSRKRGVNQFEKWSEMGLTTVARMSRYTGEGLSKKAGELDPHIFKFISHDYNSSTMAVNPKLAQREVSKIKSQISSFPFHFIPSSKALILGAGGGKDVYTALASGVDSVTAVEFNRVIVEDIMLGELEDFSGGLYRNEKVNVVVDEARNFLNRNKKKFDVIIPVMGSTPRLVAAGCYLFSTEYLQTVEAYQNYLDNLTTHGIFSFVCFFNEKNYKNILSNHYRVLATIKETLQDNGLDPARHMMVVGGKIAAADKLYSHAVCVVFSPSPFSEKDAVKARSIAQDMGFDLVYSPYTQKDVLISRFIETHNTERLYQLSPVEIRPVSDDRPFYYDHRKKGATENDEEEYIHLIYSMAWIFSFYILVILLLPIIFGRRPAHIRSPGAVIRGLGYFLCLGAGFIAIELTLMQKAQFLLGIPAYGFFAVVFSFTLFMGLGGHVARKTDPSRWNLLMIAVFLTFFSIGLVSIWEFMVQAASTWTTGSKVALVVVSLAPLGFVCGFPFVLGIRKHARERTVAWMWAINAATATMGSVVVTLLWMEWGFLKTLLLGLGCYAMAVLLL
jgi:spermidine synthase